MTAVRKTSSKRRTWAEMVPRLYGPRWRWIRAMERLEDGAAPEDETVALASRYLKAEAAGKVDPEPPGWAAVVHAARRLYDDEVSRITIEALVLAREPVEVIAKSLGLPREVIETYERLFFDVRGAMDAEGYVLNVIASERGALGGVSAFLLKVVAYHRGAEAFWCLALSKPLSDEMKQYLQRCVSGRTLINAYSASLCEQGDWRSKAAAIYHGSRRLELAEKRQEREQEAVERKLALKERQESFKQRYMEEQEQRRRKLAGAVERGEHIRTELLREVLRAERGRRRALAASGLRAIRWPRPTEQEAPVREPQVVGTARK